MRRGTRLAPGDVDALDTPDADGNLRSQQPCIALGRGGLAQQPIRMAADGRGDDLAALPLHEEVGLDPAVDPQPDPVGASWCASCTSSASSSVSDLVPMSLPSWSKTGLLSKRQSATNLRSNTVLSVWFVFFVAVTVARSPCSDAWL